MKKVGGKLRCGESQIEVDHRRICSPLPIFAERCGVDFH